MAEKILNFQKPEKVVQIKKEARKGAFEFKPLEPGFGLTIGNALRRVLLSSLEGYAITSARFSGVEHEFSTIPGIVEDVTSILLNLKKIRFKAKASGIENETVKAKLGGKKQITAGDLQKFIQNFEILNPDLVLFNAEPKVNLDVVLTIEKGRGYVTIEENKRKDVPLGTVFIDSIHTPIKHVKYAVDNYRVGQKTDYERLVIEVETDGSISPREALTEAAKILIQHFILFSDEKISIEESPVQAKEEVYDQKMLHMRQLLKTKLEDLGISVRALNCLKAAEVNTLGELVQYNKSQLMKFRNFGKKSMDELEKLVEEKGLTFGMDLSKYNLDLD